MRFRFFFLLLTCINSTTSPVDVVVYHDHDTHTGLFHSTIDNTGETGQTVFRLQRDTNFPVSSNPVCHVGPHTRPNKVTQPYTQPGVISLVSTDKKLSIWYLASKTLLWAQCWEKMKECNETGLHHIGRLGTKLMGKGRACSRWKESRVNLWSPLVLGCLVSLFIMSLVEPVTFFHAFLVPLLCKWRSCSQCLSFYSKRHKYRFIQSILLSYHEV